jgi:hypothetical protein
MPSANARIPAVHTHDGMWILPHTLLLHVSYNVGFFVWYFTQGEPIAPWFEILWLGKIRKRHTLHLLAQRNAARWVKWLVTSLLLRKDRYN